MMERAKTRIAFFAEILIEDFDGASRTMFQLLKRIDPDRFEFLFICGTGPASLYGFACIRLPSFTVPLNRNYKMAMPFLAKKRLTDALEAFQPQVIHIATPSLLGQFAMHYATRRQLPVISIYHTHFISYVDYYLSYAPFLVKKARARLAAAQRQFYNRCHTIYVPSESIEAELRAAGIEAARMSIWKRGIDTELFNPAKRSTAFLQQLTGNQQQTILFASRLVWEKNLETLFRIYDLAEQQGLPYNFVIAGDGLARKACAQRMKKACFTGKLGHTELARLYASADVFLFTSVSEAYGNVVLEAMASGLPCVIADGGGSRDFIKQGVNGFKCPPFEEAAYLDKLCAILEDPTLAARFAEQGRQLGARHNWNHLADCYFEALSGLTEKTHSFTPMLAVS